MNVVKPNHSVIHPGGRSSHRCWGAPRIPPKNEKYTPQNKHIRPILALLKRLRRTNLCYLFWKPIAQVPGNLPHAMMCRDAEVSTSMAMKWYETNAKGLVELWLQFSNQTMVHLVDIIHAYTWHIDIYIHTIDIHDVTHSEYTQYQHIHINIPNVR